MQVNYEKSEEFISDESFVSWCYKTDEKNVALWDTWLQLNPGKRSIVEEATQLLTLISQKEKPVSQKQLSEAEQQLLLAIHSEDKVVNIKRNRVWYVAAAAVIAALLITAGLYYFSASNKEIQLATQYGQVKHERLPDGTEVVLNANSKVSYGKWKEGTTREVWINGEALFHVKKTPEHSKFIVHTNAFDIEVTGTIFNVINTTGKSNIILQEGSVKIHRTGVEDIIMKPGDFVEVADDHIQKKTVTKQDYLAWTENKLVFDNTSLQEIATIIHNHYGVEVKLSGKDVANKTITGIMPNDNLDVLLKALETALDCNIQRMNNHILISSK
jgi:ferric-dicitrate binding protein FerR (iron transport regulator)